MAYVGLRHVVAAPWAGSGSASSGMVIGKAIGANLTWNRNDNPLYADDAVAEDDNGITGGQLELNLDDLSDEAAVMLLGDMQGTETGSVQYYRTVDASAPYVAVGYIRVKRKNGVTSYEAHWLYKVQFGLNSEEASTRGESIEWQTPTLTGRVMAENAGGIYYFKDRVSFETETAAVAWLNTKAGITA